MFLVDGKAMRLRDTFELEGRPAGRVLIDIHQKMFALRDTMVIGRDGEPLATIRRKRLSLLRNHYRVSLADGTELDVSGKILDREFAVEYEGELLAVISRRRLHVRETYGVDVVREDADPALLIAVAVCVIRLAEKRAGRGLTRRTGARRRRGVQRPEDRKRTTSAARCRQSQHPVLQRRELLPRGRDLPGSKSTVSTCSPAPASARTSHGSTTIE